MKNRLIQITPLYVLLSALLLLVAWVPVESRAGLYVLDTTANNRVEFHSKATLESFTGKAKRIQAEFNVLRRDLTGSKGSVTVDLRTLDTGIDMRNKHMRENHLHTDSFPTAVFKIDSIKGVDVLVAGVPTNLTVHGSMTIHGVTRTVTVPALVQFTGDKIERELRLESEFSVRLADYGITRPEFLFLKLAEEVGITVDLTLTPQAE